MAANLTDSLRTGLEEARARAEELQRALGDLAALADDGGAWTFALHLGDLRDEAEALANRIYGQCVMLEGR